MRSNLVDQSERRLIETDFPIEEVSEASSREKSIRQGHLSTLQQWWARRPLGMCRSAVFAALCPEPKVIASSPELTSILEQYFPGAERTDEKLQLLTAKLAHWEAIKDQDLLDVAHRLITANHQEPKLVVDTFAGGGSIPV
ncbi:MAG: DUF1156 domain-containing protein, partial [Nitrospira sp.]|nr:DUF1156 domain-containing protein [Nitrospira sp.]